MVKGSKSIDMSGWTELFKCSGGVLKRFVLCCIRTMVSIYQHWTAI
jgi:hypothetical protein